MIKKEITICGKQVTLGYCFATEIGFKVMAEESIDDFLKEAAPVIQDKQLPDVMKVIMLISSSMISYYESKGEEAPIEDKNMMYDTTAEELGMALGTVIGLRAKFYHIPSGEPEDKPKDGDDNPKND